MSLDRRKAPRDCKKCGTRFQPKSGASKNPSFCSRKCFLDAHPRHFCHGCTTQKTADDFHKSRHKLSGHISKCKECSRPHSAIVQRRPAQKAACYKFSAKRRGLVFALNKEEFLKFWQKPCYYCAEAIETVGLDRIDNTQGYTLNNVVSCCAMCNMMKGTMSAMEFMDRCSKISIISATLIKAIV